ncbi:MAG: mechanosensitive ion channel family protein [Clostridia bacterium]|nr:mechanosensitive ion channel family protein [Clostridia bacterium]
MPKNFTEFLQLALPFIKAALILLLGHYAIVLLLKIAQRALSKTKLDQSLIRFLLKTINISAHVLILLPALNETGISTTGFLAALSAAAIGIALALKDSLSNIAGGILLLLSPRFATGDYIGVDDNEGYVSSIELMHTTIRTYNNRHITFANAALLNSTVTNYTWEGIRRIDLYFPVSYQADITLAEKTAKEVMRNHPLVLPEDQKPLIARVFEYRDSAVILHLLPWCKCEDYWTVYYDILEQVRLALGEKGIEIPFNQLDVHLDQIPQ